MFSECSPKDKVLLGYKSIIALPHGLTALCPSKGREQWNTLHAVSVRLSFLTKWKNGDVEDLKAKSFPFRKFPASVYPIDLWVKHVLCVQFTVQDQIVQKKILLACGKCTKIFWMTYPLKTVFSMYCCKKTGDFIRS